MLKLSSITKDYTTKEDTVHVLKNVSINFRRCEFVSILGPSGCGKTTMLNIIGGLDRYTSGDIVIDGISTKDYDDHKWDYYRSRRIGFVFQSYNLIPHLTVLKNVEIALTVAGVSKAERRQLAEAALASVGLSDQIKKYPNQLSGGQMQRVAIARALVNSPDIILADEPTGALDSESGEQVMQLLKEVANDRLVIMVTHNPELARTYSNRIINILDGQVNGDTNPYLEADCDADFAALARADMQVKPSLDELEQQEDVEGASVQDGAEDRFDDQKQSNARGTQNQIGVQKQSKARSAQNRIGVQKQSKARSARRAKEKTSMSFGTAISLSANNLRSKKGRTFLTSFAGSIGIIGIMLVMGLSNGAQLYIRQMEEDALSNYPIEINRVNANVSSILTMLMQTDDTGEKYPSDDIIRTENIVGNLLENLSVLSSDNDLKKLKTYVEENFDSSMGYYKFEYGTTFDVFCNYINDAEKYMKVSPFLDGIADALPSELKGMLDSMEQFAAYLSTWDELIGNQSLLEQQYDLLGASKWPTKYNEVVLVVDEKNKIDDYTLFALGLKSPSELAQAIVGGGTFAKDTTFTVEELLNLEYQVCTNSDYYYLGTDGKWQYTSDRNLQREISFIEGTNSDGLANSVNVKVVGVVRPKKGTTVTSINGSIGYSPLLTEYLSMRADTSPIARAQKASPDVNVVNGQVFHETEFDDFMVSIGVADFTYPTKIKLYANSFDDKARIEAFIAQYNESEGESVKYSDGLGIIMGYVDTLTTTVTGVLIGFAAISLIVSSIMIATIIYTSVLERRKEIGILRSIGAKKNDISNVFIAESSMIGLISGVMGVLISLLLYIPMNLIIESKLMVANLVSVVWWQAVMMVGISFVLAVLAGFIPSRMAAKRDPVKCLRIE